MIRPREHTREFPGRPESVRDVRRFVAVTAACPALDDVALAASELAANAVRWSRSGADGGTYLVRAVVTPTKGVTVYVADRGGLPSQWAGGLDGGRGLQIVAALAQAWGIARPGVGAWTGAAAGEQDVAGQLAGARGGTCTWFRAAWAGGLSQSPDPAAAGATWLEVMERADWRCECAGVCGRPHRCPAEHAPGHALHLVPIWTAASEAAASRLPAAALAALCADCHTGAARAAARADGCGPQPGLFAGGSEAPQGRPNAGVHTHTGTRARAHARGRGGGLL